VPFPEPTVPNFTFIDLFAGMGGFRLGMQAQGGKCVFSSEWNKYAQKTYLANFGEMPFGDITKKSTKSYIPKKFDVLVLDFLASPSLLLGFPKKQLEGKLDLKIRRKERYFSMSLK
jgi:DNA (cytosine-5)-methyltransferase 1